MQILFEDDDLVAVEKPAWWVVHPTRGAKGAKVVIEELQQQLGQPIFPVHRLDRQASGVMVFAKSSDVSRTMAAEMQQGQWHKRYLALCRGVIVDSVIVDHPVREGNARREACSQIDPVEVYCSRFSLVQVSPRSGRRHQIRYHMRHIGHPLVCDSNYGSTPINHFFRDQFALDRLFLHAEFLRLPHPRQLRQLELRSELPEPLRQLLARLAAYDGPVP